MNKYLKFKWLASKFGLLWLLVAVLPAISKAGDNASTCQQEAIESGMVSAADIQSYVDQCAPGQMAIPGYDQEQPVYDQVQPVDDQAQPVVPPVVDEQVQQPVAPLVDEQVQQEVAPLVGDQVQQQVAPEPNIEQQYNPVPEYNADMNYSGAESGEDPSED